MESDFWRCNHGIIENGEAKLQISGTTGAISASKLKEYITYSISENKAPVNIFIDACHSGGLIGQGVSDEEFSQKMEEFTASFSDMSAQSGELANKANGGFHVLCACKGSELAQYKSCWYSYATNSWTMGCGWYAGAWELGANEHNSIHGSIDNGPLHGFNCSLRADGNNDNEVTIKELYDWSILMRNLHFMSNPVSELLGNPDYHITYYSAHGLNWTIVTRHLVNPSNPY